MDWISIEKIKRGDVYWESEGGQDAAFIALANARRAEGGIEVPCVEIATGKLTRHWEADRCGPYGVRLYRGPQYTRPDWAALLSAAARVWLADADTVKQGAADCEREAQAKVVAAANAVSAAEAKSRRLEEENARLRGQIARARLQYEQLDVLNFGSILALRVRAIIDEQV